MDTAILLVALLAVVAIVVPRAEGADGRPIDWRHHAAFWVCVGMIGASPILGAETALALGFELTASTLITCSWFWVVASLPASLAVARLFGRANFANYLQHLEVSSKVSSRTLAMIWGGLLICGLAVVAVTR